ncbi:MAG: cytochrome c [Proteobacteria bacterium]|nr:cytochrome c [Pseudomonadota bacterium]
MSRSFLLASFILLSPAVFAENDALRSDAAQNDIKQGEHLYKTYCSTCHGLTGGMDMRQRIAPPIAAVRFHYIGTYPDKASFVAAITDWVGKQDENKSLMRGAIRRFNIMPPITVSKKDAEKIAHYIFAGNLDKPAGFDEHVKEMHGSH